LRDFVSIDTVIEFLTEEYALISCQYLIIPIAYTTFSESSH